HFSPYLGVKNMYNLTNTKVPSDTIGMSVDTNGGSVLGVLEEVIHVGQAMSDSLGNSSGILCIWEVTVFKKDYVTISDSFVAIYGTWLSRNAKILFVAIYAPQQAAYKRVLWDYLSILLGRWNGYAFTWSHPLATKMSKLDRFLVSDGVFSLFPSITALCLDRHLSDHRPILLREVYLDFGLIPFRFYHSWFSFVGFDEMVEQTWRSFSHSDRNGMICFKKKLQELKSIIRHWIKDKRAQLSGSKQAIINELRDIDKELDQGVKSKVRWAIEGDENLKYFHWIINKKRSQLAILGVFVNGIWHNDPRSVKEAFHNHYEARFKKPTTFGLKLNFPFPKRLLQDQVVDLERYVSRDEIRLAVWNYGENKSSDPDGKNKKAIFFKVDFAKAYDSVRWDYLMDVLEAFGFGLTWCKWIQGTFCFTKALVLVNRSPSNEFQFHCGLKQGDPLSPYLFILVMESLHLSFSRAVDEWLFTGIRLEMSLSLSHPFYADNALFIGEWNNANLTGIINILKCFYLASGLQINILKSQVLGVGVPRSIVEATTSSIGCSIMQNQFRYLSVMEGECMSRHKAWVDVVLKLRSRISKWKAKTLSIGGRLTLLKSVLVFLMGLNLRIKKITWAAWDKVLASKKKGGLGVSSFYALNCALLLKWVWRFVSQDGSLWFRVIQALYGPMIDTQSVHKASSWCSIMREVHLLKMKGFDFLCHCNKRIGDGNNTRFWLDIWKGDRTLRDAFPRMFALESQFTDLASTMDSVSLSSSHDRWVCNLSGDGEFRVQEVRNFIDDLFLPSHPEPTRWVKYIPIKINIFAWRACRDCLPTRCDLARAVLRRVCRWWDLDWQLWSSFSDWYSWFSPIRLSSKVKSLLENVHGVDKSRIRWHRLPVFLGLTYLAMRRHLHDKYNLLNVGKTPVGARFNAHDFAFRTADGKFNDPSSEVAGSEGTFFGRNMPPVYQKDKNLKTTC
nr:RNA-directed DNA polymerase, eukaryota [Tanacetum cinerariifolium]